MSLRERLKKSGSSLPGMSSSQPVNTSAPGGTGGDQPLPDHQIETSDKGERFEEVKSRIHTKLVDNLSIGADQLNPSDIHEAAKNFLNELLTYERIPMGERERRRLLEELVEEILGYGPLEPLLRDPSVTEIMVNGPKKVYIERAGKLTLTSVRFKDDAHVMHIIERIVSAVGRRVDEKTPMVDARLKDGSRFNAIIPPLALDGPTMTIRKFRQDAGSLDKLLAWGSLTEAMSLTLEAAVKVHMNIVISGGTGSGKTTMLNSLSHLIANDERIVTIEDSAELQLRQEHVVRLESRPPNIEGEGQIAIRQLLINSLRMRPDRIIVGECRGGETLDMLQAMNTGHDGSLTTLHANTPRDALARIETMCMMNDNPLPSAAIRQQVASAIHLIVQVSRLSDGSRRTTHIAEIIGMEGDIITMQEIFKYEQLGLDDKGKVVGRHVATGVRPRFAEKCKAKGIELPQDAFTKDTLDDLKQQMVQDAAESAQKTAETANKDENSLQDAIRRRGNIRGI